MGTVILLSALLLATTVTTIVNSTPILGEYPVESDIEVGSSSVTSTASTTTAEPEDQTQENNDTVTTPRDADPYDCKNATQKGHIYLSCQYGCGGDEMLMALDNATCYLHPPNETTELLIEEMYNNTEPHNNETGICFNGECIPRLTNASESSTQSSPTQSSINQSVEGQTQETDVLTTPADADPYDCRNATQAGHIYLSCSYGCGGDEMLMALNNATCYLHPPNMTGGVPSVGEYNSKYNSNEIGVCFEGECRPNFTDTTAATTGSSTGTTATTTTAPDETSGETASPVNEDAPSKPEEPKDSLEPVSEDSHSQDIPKNAVGSSEDNEDHVGSPDADEVTSSAPHVPVALP
ncbi:uncharacterized protein LOC144144430 [Haemaphysalis longicornis]